MQMQAYRSRLPDKGEISATPPNTASASLDRRSTGPSSSTRSSRKFSTSIPQLVQGVVAIDFGTTFSGFSYAVFSDIQTKHGSQCENVHVFENWPWQAHAGMKYCKTQTSLWYVPGEQPGTFQLKGWGWEGYVAYQQMLQEVRKRWEQEMAACETQSSLEAARRPPCRHQELDVSRAGYFITRFKLGLHVDGRCVHLPEGLTLKRVITDFLQQMSFQIMKELENRYGRRVNKRLIRFCLTVPAIWTEEAKQVMKECAEAAGLVQGTSCNDEQASCHELVIVVEPEAASVYCNQTLTVKEFCNGQRFLVVDVGGGTVDMVVHEKVGTSTRSAIKVREVRVSTGAAVGGCHVDEAFFDFLRKKISCFRWFEATYPARVLEINRWWGDMKASYDGDVTSFTLPLPPLLANCWAKDSNSVRVSKFSDVEINSGTLRKIFDPVVDKVLDLIEDHMTEALDAILVVGGFSNSPYLCRKIRSNFKDRVKDIVVPPCPGAAVLKGAVSFGVVKEWENLLNSRVAKLTYGFDTTASFKVGKHPKKFMVLEKGTKRKRCDNIFEVLIRKGDPIPIRKVVKHTCAVFYSEDMDDDEDEIEVIMYSTHSRDPQYITDRGVRKEAACKIPVPSAKQAPARYAKPKIEISLQFGGTAIRGFVRGKNYLTDTQAMTPIQFKWFSGSDKTVM
ncbi:hypothetical protein Mapa_004067 [Marchantia paleacea]|nr:hypothetical protein Mapa_004067 [Marchantia paleacea]